MIMAAWGSCLTGVAAHVLRASADQQAKQRGVSDKQALIGPRQPARAGAS